MQKSLSNASARQELLDRLERLTPEATPLWGRLSAHQMLAHLADWMRMAKGDMRTTGRKHPFRHPPLKQLAIYWLPFPKGVPTSPELIARVPADWSVECDAIRDYVQSFESPTAGAVWPEHPVFGRMTPEAWCVFAYRHMDHHLRHSEFESTTTQHSL